MKVSLQKGFEIYSKALKISVVLNKLLCTKQAWFKFLMDSFVLFF